MKTKTYVVAPGVTADLCKDCWLRLPPQELLDDETFRGHLIHDEWVEAGGHLK